MEENKFEQCYGCKSYQLAHLARISRSEGAMVETLSCPTFVDHAESWFHTTRVIVTLFAREAREWCSRTDPIRASVVFSARLPIAAGQSVVVCPG